MQDVSASCNLQTSSKCAKTVDIAATAAVSPTSKTTHDKGNGGFFMRPSTCLSPSREMGSLLQLYKSKSFPCIMPKGKSKSKCAKERSQREKISGQISASSPSYSYVSCNSSDCEIYSEILSSRESCISLDGAAVRSRSPSRSGSRDSLEFAGFATPPPPVSVLASNNLQNTVCSEKLQEGFQENVSKISPRPCDEIASTSDTFVLS